MSRKEDILQAIAVQVVDYNEEKIQEVCRQALDDGIAPLDIIMNGLAAGMIEVGDLFERKEYFVPEVLMCADTLNIGLNIVKPHLPKGASINKGKVIIGTVQGDVHDIGKNLIKLMCEIGGYEIIDLGNDVPLERFAAEQKATGADIVAMSAMMTTTMLGMKKAIEMIKENKPKCRVIIGGAPVTRQVVDLFGADGYSESAGSVLSELDRMMASIRQNQTMG